MIKDVVHEELGFNRLKQINDSIKTNIDRLQANLNHIFAKHESIPAYPLLIRAYTGGAQSEQYGPFTAAISRVQKMFIVDRACFHVEYLTLPEIRKNYRQYNKPVDVIEWLKLSDVHFLICHLHQGNQNVWKPLDVSSSIRLLESHIGFPSGSKVYCPILTQDKGVYLRAIEEIANPTFRIPLQSHITPSKIEIISSFMQSNHEGAGWVLKCPFQTNQRVKYPKTSKDVISGMRCYIKNEHFRLIPYAILQPCMSNKKEYKVVCVNGIACSLNLVNSVGVSFSSPPHSSLFQFCENAISLLRERRPESITDGIVRVDVFQNREGKYIVNEFESLEAITYAGGGRVDIDIYLSELKINYWVEKVLQYVYERLQSEISTY